MVPSTNIFMVPCFHRWTVQYSSYACAASPVSQSSEYIITGCGYCTLSNVAPWRSEAGNSSVRLKFQPTEHNAEKKIGEKIISRSSLYLWYHVSIYLSCITKQNTSKMPSEAARTNRLLDWGWWTVTHQLHLLPPGRPLDFPTHSCGMASSPPSILCPRSAAAG